MNESSSTKVQGSTSPGVINATGLPKSYGDTKIVIMPRDPVWFFAYWEVSQGTIDETRGRIGVEKFNSSRWVLRVYDVTDINFDGKNAHRFFDIFVDRAETWYVNAGEMNRSWCVDLGLVTADGSFIAIVRSNIVKMPRQGVSPISDEHWAILQTEFERLLKLSGVEQIGHTSFDVAKLMRERWEEIVSLSLPSSAGLGGASSWSSRGGAKEHEVRPKGFWLKADTELIVYGATEPDAHLTVQGQTVSLRPDGTFTLRFYLPDGVQEYPIHATSSDGTMEREITFVVRRDTK
ncbi:MAG: DUF4912 domain-containing protein [Endomicrobiales bacterium]|jgi:hypothetical protein